MSPLVDRAGHLVGRPLCACSGGRLWWVADREPGDRGVCPESPGRGDAGACRSGVRRAKMRRLAWVLAGRCGAPAVGLDGHLRRASRRAAILTRRWQRRFGRAGLKVDPEGMAVAALLHDIGKIGVPRAILPKAGPLTAEERAAVERHPRWGSELPHALTFWAPPAAPAADHLRRLTEVAGEVVMHHHEHGDGSGYPDGLSGEAIPLGARLLVVVDVYDALRHPRPYKCAWPEASTLSTWVCTPAPTSTPRSSPSSSKWRRDRKRAHEHGRRSLAPA